MVEEVKERDIMSQVRMMYVGDDTGLLKKVKLTAKRTELEHTTVYGGLRTITKRRKLDNGEIEEVTFQKRGGALTAADN